MRQFNAEEALEQLIKQAEDMEKALNDLPASVDKYSRRDIDKLIELKKIVNMIMLRVELLEFNFFAGVSYDDENLF